MRNRGGGLTLKGNMLNRGVREGCWRGVVERISDSKIDCHQPPPRPPPLFSSFSFWGGEINLGEGGGKGEKGGGG